MRDGCVTPRVLRIGYGTSMEQSDLVRGTLEPFGWSTTLDGEWGLWWSSGRPPRIVFEELPAGRFLNHLPGVDALSRKDGLADTVDRARRRLGHDGWTIAPPTFVMPRDRERLLLSARRRRGAVWILKPAASARGQDVRLLESAEDAPDERGWVVQRYIADPHLLDGYKYTLRCYLLIRATDPIRLYMYRDGFAKLTSRPFTMASDERANPFVHLTNPDILALDPTVRTSERNLTHEAYRRRIAEEGIDDAALFDRIKRVVAAAVLGARERLRERHVAVAGGHEGCFELLGLDVIVDRELRPWLLECNYAPALAVMAVGSTPSQRDEARIKKALVRDVLGLVGVIGKDGAPVPEAAARLGTDRQRDAVVRAGAEVERAGGFDRIWPAPGMEDLLPFIACVRPADRALLATVGTAPSGPGSLVTSDRAVVRRVGEGLVVLDDATGTLNALNETASFLWAGLSEGCSTDELTDELVSTLSDAGPTAAIDVPDAVGPWIEDGLFHAPGRAWEPPRPRTAVSEPPRSYVEWNGAAVYGVMGSRIAVHTGTVEIAAAVDRLLGHLKIGAPEEVDEDIHIGHRPDGFVLSDATGFRARFGRVEQLIPAIRERAIAAAVRRTEALLILRGTGLRAGDRCVLLLDRPHGGREAIVSHWVGAHGRQVVADDVAVITQDGSIAPSRLGLPVPFQVDFLDRGAEMPFAEPDGQFSRYVFAEPCDPTLALAASAITFVDELGETTEISTLEPLEGFRRLIDNSFFRDNKDGRWLDAVLDWFGSLVLHRLSWSDAAQAAGALSELLLGGADGRNPVV